MNIGSKVEGEDQPAVQPRAIRLLALGAATGLLLAAIGILEPAAERGSGVPDDAVAVVNGEAIRRDDYQRLLAGLESDSRNPIDDRARKHVLDRMIDEELLVQRALELGLAQVDRRVRADLTSSLIASVVSGAEEREPEPSELRDFYEQQSDFFTRPGRLRVRQIFFRVSPSSGGEDGAQARATAARSRVLAGEPFAEVRDDAGDAVVSPIPDVLLPALKLREYIGPTAMGSALELDVGELSEPIRSGVGLHLLELVDHTPSRTPPLDEIEKQVHAEWRRRTGDRALRLYLDELRMQNEVVTMLELE
jgi:parvulin-like peptidyl-prolyl isomerase